MESHEKTRFVSRISSTSIPNPESCESTVKQNKRCNVVPPHFDFFLVQFEKDSVQVWWRKAQNLPELLKCYFFFFKIIVLLSK